MNLKNVVTVFDKYPEISSLKNLEERINNFNKIHSKIVIWDANTAKQKIQNIPRDIAKLHKLYLAIGKDINTVQEILGTLYIEKYVHYKTEYDIVLKDSEIKQFIQSDRDYIELENVKSRLSTFLDIIEKSIKNIDSLRWDIKNYLEWQKFISGDLS